MRIGILGYLNKNFEQIFYDFRKKFDQIVAFCKFKRVREPELMNLK